MQLLNQSWNGKDSVPPGQGSPRDERGDPSLVTSETTETLTRWLISQLADRLELDPQQIDPHQELIDYGLNSIEAVSLSGDLENFLGRRLSPTLLWDYPTISALARHLADDLPPSVLNSPYPSGETFRRVAPMDSEEARQILQDLDGLSDAEVEALLARLLSEEEG